MAIIFEELDIEQSCVTCKYFVSYREGFEDNDESSIYGRCSNKEIDEDLTFGDGMSCSLHNTQYGY